jgi:hypothetical protein
MNCFLFLLLFTDRKTKVVKASTNPKILARDEVIKSKKTEDAAIPVYMIFAIICFEFAKQIYSIKTDIAIRVAKSFVLENIVTGFLCDAYSA